MKWIETVRTIAARLEAERNSSAPAAGWDPYDVWLNRLRTPREARLGLGARIGASPARDGTPTPMPTA